jgi:hypothetical protein
MRLVGWTKSTVASLHRRTAVPLAREGGRCPPYISPHLAHRSAEKRSAFRHNGVRRRSGLLKIPVFCTGMSGLSLARVVADGASLFRPTLRSPIIPA